MRKTIYRAANRRISRIEDCECDFPSVNVGAGVWIWSAEVSVKKFWKLLIFNFVPVWRPLLYGRYGTKPNRTRTDYYLARGLTVRYGTRSRHTAALGNTRGYTWCHEKNFLPRAIFNIPEPREVELRTSIDNIFVIAGQNQAEIKNIQSLHLVAQNTSKSLLALWGVQDIKVP